MLSEYYIMDYISYCFGCSSFLLKTDVFEDISKDIRKGKTEESEVSLLCSHFDQQKIDRNQPMTDDKLNMNLSANILLKHQSSTTVLFRTTLT